MLRLHFDSHRHARPKTTASVWSRVLRQALGWYLAIGAVGCAFPADSSPFGQDPFAKHFSSINARYSASWLTFVPTVFGNIVGGLVAFPVAMIVAPVEWIVRDHPGDDCPVTTGTLAAGGYTVGFLTGSPLMLLYWGVVHPLSEPTSDD